MTSKLKISDELPVRLGAFKPIGHVVVALENDERATEMAGALHEAGFADDDVLVLRAADMAQRLKTLLPEASGAAGFGSEIEAMRAFHQRAEQGNGWLIVYAPERETEQRVAEVARRFRAEVARKYNLLTVEELI